MAENAYIGLAMIGDPHLEGRQPGFRKDDYPNVVLEKLAWCLDYARTNCLLPVILGDLFDKPRDNPNWMLVRLLELFSGEIVGVYGNHDCADPELKDHDSLSVLVQAGRLRLLKAESPWQGQMAGRPIVLGGSSYRCKIPESYVPPSEKGGTSGGPAPLVIWLTHHDLMIPGYDEGRWRPRELPGIDLVINGHIHRRLDDVRTGQTQWLTPGNISRRKRSDATRDHVPSLLRIDVGASGYDVMYVSIPHRPFDEVFHEAVVEAASDVTASAFVTGLAELQSRRTASGAGLLEFLHTNLGQFEPEVAGEILSLANEVANDGIQ